jgi:hypothetical protein
MLRFVLSALVAGTLLIPAGISTYSGQALAQATNSAAEKADQGKAAKKKAAQATEKNATQTTEKKKKRELTAGQKSARERQRQCGQEWRDAKKAGTTEKGMTWPKFWSACNTRLKGKST